MNLDVTSDDTSTAATGITVVKENTGIPALPHLRKMKTAPKQGKLQQRRRKLKLLRRKQEQGAAEEVEDFKMDTATGATEEIKDAATGATEETEDGATAAREQPKTLRLRTVNVTRHGKVFEREKAEGKTPWSFERWGKKLQ